MEYRITGIDPADLMYPKKTQINLNRYRAVSYKARYELKKYNKISRCWKSD